MATPRLYITASVEEQWNALTGPWLRAHAADAWKDKRPTVVLTPTRAESFYLRGRMVEEGISYLGLRFWTPSDARKFLLAKLELKIGAPNQAELRLVARTCAEKLAGRAGSAGSAIPTLNSVVREPGPFLRAYDLLVAAGSDPARDGAAYGRDLAREMKSALDKFQIDTQAGIHRRLRREVLARSEPLLANLLLVGFNAAHWPLWDLLKAGAFSAEDGVVALSDPRYFAEEIDQLWVSSWEELVQSEAMTPLQDGDSPAPMEERAAPFAGLVASYEKGDGIARPNGAVPPGFDLIFRVTPDLGTQVHAVVLQTLDFLKNKTCTRLGIVFAETNALALGVAEELHRLNIPLNDGTGRVTPGIFEKRAWPSWIALQEESGVPRLLAWVRACEAEGLACCADPTLRARDLAGILDSALGETLVDNLDFLVRYLQEKSNSDRAQAVTDFLRQRIALPESATFSGFLELTRRAVSSLGWEDYSKHLEVDPPEWQRKSETAISRRTFLEWLKEVTDSRSRTRGADCNHFYGRVHLLIYAQMTGQTWSHLILTGLNEGVWPQFHEPGAFGSRYELAQLNQQARASNRTARSQGRQGYGHETVRPDRGHCLLPLERQDLALRDICAALESTSTSACLTAMTTEGGRSLLPSDFFNHAYQIQTGRVLDEDVFRMLALTTADWCERHYELLVPASGTTSVDLTGIQIAHTARHDSVQPFGPYEFAFAHPPPRPIQLSCKRWEDAWNHPSCVWLDDVVGAPAWADGTLSWPRAIGTWAHRWLAISLREWRELKSAASELPVLVWGAADRDAHAVKRRAQEAKMELYPWWDQVWLQARTVALGLVETLAPLLPDRQFLCEFQLPKGLLIALPGTDQTDFLLRGRIDLVLIEPGAIPHDLDAGDFSGCACWVIDYKTGSARTLTAKRVGEGKGLQPLLYALAVQTMGAATTAISLHTLDAPLKPQVKVDDLHGTEPLFRSLDKLHHVGIFGMRPDANEAYGYSPAYPIATRFIPANILESKWALVHGNGPTTTGEQE